MSTPNPRAAAITALGMIDEGARSQAALEGVRSADMADRDRAFVTELVNGVCRMRRRCDALIEPHLRRRPDPDVRAALRLGAYQLDVLETPAHAAVAETVEVAPPHARGFVNAVLRRIADGLDTARAALAPADLLSYPDWIIDLADSDIGADARAALEAMNRPERPRRRADGYIQGTASKWVAEEVRALEGDFVVDLCAAPGGKATWLGARRVTVAAELDADRVLTLRDNVDALGADVHVLRADARNPPLAPACADIVLLDAPCSGLGALGRRADARWRARPRDVRRLANLQGQLLDAATTLIAPGGRLAYAVCTWTTAETTGVADAFAERNPEWTTTPLHGAHWRPHGTGGIVLPHDHRTDAMAMFIWQRPS